MTDIYEQRVVLFLDILGFKKLIDEGKESLIMTALDVPKGVQLGPDGQQKRYPFNGQTSMQISAFSDSIAVSDAIDDGRGLIRIVHYACYLWWKFLAKGVLTRGGIAVGRLHHQDGVLFGPAMNEAYELESLVSIYPRIAVSNGVRDQLRQAIVSENSGVTDPFMLQMRLNILRRDFDGVFHVNTLGRMANTPEDLVSKKPPDPVTGGTSYTEQEIFEAKSTLTTKILQQRPGGVRVAAKYDWLANYLSLCAQQMASVPRSSA